MLHSNEAAMWTVFHSFTVEACRMDLVGNKYPAWNARYVYTFTVRHVLFVLSVYTM